MNNPSILVPVGSCASDIISEDAAAARRKQLRERLLRGEEVIVTQAGEVADKKQKTSGEPAIVVPEGKLAASFYWYERDAELFQNEKSAMAKFFPQFRLQKLEDGRLSWEGQIRPRNIAPRAVWQLQAIYNHNHPDSSTYGGSIMVYSVQPDLDAIERELGAIPHTLRDATGSLYICTARATDFKSSVNHSTTAASSLAWAAKWIAAFELWMAGDLATSDFSGHKI